MRSPAIPRATTRERETIARIAKAKSFENIDPDEVHDIVEKYGSVDETREYARDYASRARKALEQFPDSEAKEALDLALDFVMERDK